MTLLVHLVDFSKRTSWIEDQMVSFEKHGIDQGLLSISVPGELHETLHQMGFSRVQNIQHNVSGLFRASSLLREWSKDDVVYVYAHGHLASVYASFIRTLTGIDFVICHHQPPQRYFFFLRKKMFFRASIHMALANFYLFRARRIQSFSPEVTQSLVYRGVNLKKIFEIPLGIYFEKYFESSRKPARDSLAKEIRIVSISRLAWEKRMDLGIRTVARLIELGVPISYVILGEGPELANLQNLVKEFGLEGQVSLPGWRDNVKEIFNDADVFFHLSLTESYGQVLMEARLAGVPIFSTPCGVALEMEKLEDSKVRIFRGSDPEVIAEEFLGFLDTLESQQGTVESDPRELYARHNFENVLLELEDMFDTLFKT